jgi:ATP-dependent helicase HrpB
VPRYEPDVGVTRLETVRVSRAAADQRRGRAGRTEPGVCYRLWDEPQTAVLEPFARPEILAADLSSFALDLAAWGAAPDKLAFLDPPPRAAFGEANALLNELGAVDADGRITEEGKKLRQLPLPPRLARMMIDAAAEGSELQAAELAALIGERGLGSDAIDLRERLNALHRDRTNRGRDARAMAQRWAEIASSPLPLVGRRGGWGSGRERTAKTHAEDLSASAPAPTVPTPTPGPSPQGGGEGRAAREEISVGALIALAYPERIAKNRGGDRTSSSCAFLLVNGRGANVDSASPLAREPFLAVAELTGTAAQGRILSAAPIALSELEARFGDHIESRDEITFDAASGSLRGRRSRKLGAIALVERPIQIEPSDETAKLFAEKIASVGIDRLPWTKATRQWRDRVTFLRTSEGQKDGESEWPDLSDAALAQNAREWLAPLLAGKTSIGEIAADELAAALQEVLPWPLRRRLDAEAPTHFEAPTGTQAAIDYESEGGPKIAIRLQELFGLDRHPTIAGGRIPLVIELLSPAHRPVQTTRDLPGFWRGSYAAVRTEMRGRYPRHPWPDDPLSAPATRRAKPRN